MDASVHIHTATDKRQHARLSRSGPGFDPWSGQVSWVRFFRGFSSPVRQISGSFRPPKSPNINWPSLSSFHILLVRMNGCVDGVYRLSCYVGWCVSSFMFVLSRRWPRHWADPSSGETLHVLVLSKKYACDPELIPSPDRSWLFKARMSHEKAPIRRGVKLR